MSSPLIYLFAVCDRPFALPDEFSELIFHAEADFFALISHVPEAEFGEAAIDLNLQNMEWLAVKAARHQAVIDLAIRSATVLPFKFASLFADNTNLVHALSTQGAAFREKLTYLRGKSEYGLKVYLGTDAAAHLVDPAHFPQLAALDAEMAQAAPGRAFLLGRKRAQLVAESEQLAVGKWVDGLYATLAGMASQAKVNPLRSRRASGREDDMVLNAAFLLVDEKVAEFESIVAKLMPANLAKEAEIELSGPWAAYNFS